MPGLSQLLETARRALNAQQLGISVTGHNIANASTPGFSRQQVELVPSPAIFDSSGLIGTGVMAVGVSRLRSGFIDQQIRSSNQALGQATSEQQILSQVEATFNEPSDSSLSSAMNNFFNSWQDLATHPEDTVSRNAVLQRASQMTETFRSLNTDLTTFRGSLRDDISGKVTQINTLTKEISDLNLQIIGGSAMGVDSSDLKDQRDLRLEELSKLANINVSEDALGSVMVSLGGTVIASKGGPTLLTVAAAPAVTAGGSTFDQLKIVTENGGGDVALSSGELGGVLKSYNATLPDSLGKLDQLAQGMISAVNTPQAAGFGLGTPAPTGINFFSGTGASTIQVDLTDTTSGAAPGSAVNVNNIAAAAGPPPPAAGDNRTALQIAGLANTAQASLGGNSVTQFYNELVSGVGSSVNAAANLITSHQLVITQLEGQRESVSGVSLDEEMTNLIKFQRAYDAAARIVNTANAMYQTVLNMMG